MYRSHALLILIIAALMQPAASQDWGKYGPITGGAECMGDSCSVEVVYRHGAYDGPLTLKYGVDGAYSDSVSVTPSLEDDYVAHFTLTGLFADTVYDYRILADGLPVSGPHTFMTFPEPDQERSFRFVVFADGMPGRLVPGYADAINNDHGFAGEGVDIPPFMLQIGDLTHADPASHKKNKVTISDFRRMYHETLARRPPGKAFAQNIAPNMHFFHTWDDHDYLYNDADGNDPQKLLAKKAFLEYIPTVDITPSRMEGPRAGIWQKFRYAQAEFYLLDTRYNRGVRRYFGLEKKMVKRLSRYTEIDRELLVSPSMLGNEQFFWLLDSIKSSDAKWKFIITSSLWNREGTKTADSWNDFPEERDLLEDILSDILKDHKQSGLTDGERIILISGDIHSGGAVDLALDNGNAFPEISVPHMNAGGGQPSTTGRRAGRWLLKEPGEWYFFNPGRILHSDQDPPPGEEPGRLLPQGNSGYAIIEVHTGDEDWVNVKLVNIPFLKDPMVGERWLEPRIVFQTPILLDEGGPS